MEERRENIMGTQPINRLLPSMAFPIMLSMLVQALYNVVDSVFVSMVSENALTSVSLAFPVQNLMIAVSVGTAVGINALLSRRLGEKNFEAANKVAENGIFVTVLSWAVFAVFGAACSGLFMGAFTQNAEILAGGTDYMWIVTVFSLGLFMSVTMERVLQVTGKTVYQMISQMTGAVVNIILDPVFIFGWLGLPAMGVAGAAWATVAGQFVAAAITGVKGCRRPPALAQQRRYAAAIYKLGIPSILMQMTVTLYIVALNIILAGFSDEAVTILGLYYKIQTFFFIPLLGLQTCIVPALSYNYGRGEYGRTRAIFRNSMLASMALMLVGIFCFEFMPQTLLGLFSRNEIVLTQGARAFRIIALSFIPTVAALLLPVFFQAIGQAFPSILLSLTRQIFCLIPIFYVLSRIGLDYVWFAFPIAEVITGSVGAVFYFRLVRQWKNL